MVDRMGKEAILSSSRSRTATDGCTPARGEGGLGRCHEPWRRTRKTNRVLNSKAGALKRGGREERHAGKHGSVEAAHATARVATVHAHVILLGVAFGGERPDPLSDLGGLE